MRTLPKKGGKYFSLPLREWGLFSIESLLRGRVASVKLIVTKKATPRYNKERRMTLMKKLARLTALLLTGALLLALLDEFTRQRGGERLLGEINSYRATLEFAAPLEEVKQLSDAEQIWVEQFRAAGKTELPESTTNETHQKWASMTGNWTRCDTFGLGMKKDASGELIDILLAKVPANTPEGKAELSEALKHPAFNRSACTKIGIAVVTIDGQMYWTCSVYS